MGHLDWLHLLAIMTNYAINIDTQTSLRDLDSDFFEETDSCDGAGSHDRSIPGSGGTDFMSSLVARLDNIATSSV